MKGVTVPGDFPMDVTASDHMRPSLHALFLSAALSIVLTSAIAAQTIQSPTIRSTLDSVFTAEQARRGAAVMNEVCANCHFQNWFTGTFLALWDGARVGYFYDLISSTMPEDRPSSLSAREYRDVIAYIFELNGLPAGTRELPDTKRELDKILIKQQTP